MNNQTLVIYDFNILYEIFIELQDHINFNLINTKKLSDIDLEKKENYIFSLSISRDFLR